MKSTRKTGSPRSRRAVSAVALLPTLVLSLPIMVVMLAPVTASAERDSVFHFRDMGGLVHDVEAILAAGRPVVFVFWQTWCPSCKREAPELADAVERYGDRVQFFGVISGPDEDIDDRDVAKTAADWGHTQPQIRDRDLSLAKRFGVTGTPVIVVLGTEGRVLFRGTRLPGDWSAFLPLRAGA